MGMEKILKGILRYRQTYRKGMVEQFERIRDDPKPTAILFSCMDSRVLPTRFTQTNVGDMFMIRNAGNLIPHKEHLSFSHITTETAGLELACIIGNIKHIVVCGHSDCKAMNALYAIRDTVHIKDGTPLQMWIKKHGVASLRKFEKLEVLGSKHPLTFVGESDKHTFEAYIDPEDRFNITDRLALVNVLQQLQNISSHAFLKEKLESEQARIHAMFFDIYTGDVFIFNRERKRFITVDEETVETIFFKDNLLMEK